MTKEEIIIQPQDLRIGNWLKCSLGELMKVTQIGHVGNPNYIAAEGKDGFCQNDFQPIPITPEILMKAGFKKEGECMRIKYSIIEFETDESVGYQEVLVSCKGNNIRRANKLHQLQNLYYSLTGKELEINL